jgi:hypothetical protein
MSTELLLRVSLLKGPRILSIVVPRGDHRQEFYRVPTSLRRDRVTIDRASEACTGIHNDSGYGLFHVVNTGGSASANRK